VGITGAGGKVGGVLAKTLLNEPNNKYELRLFFFNAPSFTTGQGAFNLTDTILSELPRQCEVVKGLDFGKTEEVKGAFDGLDVVIHLAAIADPYSTWSTLKSPNFDAVVNVYDECVRAKVKRLIFASSNHTQNGVLTTDPTKVESLDFSKVKKPLQISDVAYPDSMYAVGKLFGEEVGKLYAIQYKLEVVSLRIGWLKDYDKDDPSELIGTTGGEYMRAIYLSRRDCVEIVKASLECNIQNEHGVPYLCVYACSNNTKKIWDIESSCKALGYYPVDNVEIFYTK